MTNDQKVRDGYVDLVCATRPNLFITLTTNGGTPNAPISHWPMRAEWRCDKVQDLVRQWDARFHHALLCRNWMTSHIRLQGWSNVEKEMENPHAHLLLKGMCVLELEEIQWLANMKWKSLIPSGTVDVRPVGNLRRRAGYVTKEMRANSCTSKMHWIGPSVEPHI